ncbi:MAG: LysR family transcriptional regulator [Rhodospirillales bacterium]|nr:LysR family transcriptional regulator [Rhodospirillales bacterium]
MINYTLRQAKYFVAAADHGSIAGAALSLNVAQPSVSSAVAKLEDVLGVQLFIRHHAQGVSLTPAGQRMVVEMRALLGHAGDVLNSAVQTGEEVAGIFDVGCFLTIASFYMPRLIKDFQDAYPDAQIRLTEGMQNDLVTGLETGQFELAVVYSADLPENLDTEPLADFPPYVLLPEGHKFANRAELSLEEMIDEPMILLDMLPSSRYFTTLFIHLGFEPNIQYRSPSFETVRSMVGNGFGYSVLVTRPAGDLTYDGKRIVAIPLSDDVPQGAIVLARMARTRPTRMAQAFATVCKNHFADTTRH